jgi:hypothetical protein
VSCPCGQHISGWSSFDEQLDDVLLLLIGPERTAKASGDAHPSFDSTYRPLQTPPASYLLASPPYTATTHLLPFTARLTLIMPSDNSAMMLAPPGQDTTSGSARFASSTAIDSQLTPISADDLSNITGSAKSVRVAVIDTSIAGSGTTYHTDRCAGCPERGRNDKAHEWLLKIGVDIAESEQSQSLLQTWSRTAVICLNRWTGVPSTSPRHPARDFRVTAWMRQPAPS